MSLLDNLPDRCTIQRVRRTSDGMGGRIDAPIVEQTDVECWVQQASASETMDYMKRGIKIDQKVYFNTNPNVTERHEIVVTKRSGVAIAVADQRAFEVISSPDPDASAGLGVVWKVMVAYVTGRGQ